MERYNSHRSNPSFSSTLLDSIYRSIDQGDDDLVHYKETMRKKQHSMVENWMSEYSSYGLNKPKPIRTTDFSVKTKNHETGFVKKVKKPISPGARLATFLNSIFTNSRKSKLSVSSSNSATVSTCSSASSFSRSCLSKNNGKSNGKSNGKRSVRFEEPNLESVKNIRNKINEELKLHEKNRRVEEAAKELLRNYQKNQVFDDDDDGASCASSDLFELDNLSVIGMQELPVYETTHFDSNRFRNGVRI